MTNNNNGDNRRKLSDILNGGAATFRDAWDSTEAAGDFAAIPAGTYPAKIISGELSESRTGTPSYKLTFRLTEGEHAGRQVWHDLWLTAAALPMSKRDLSKIGVTSADQLDQPLPAVLRCTVKIALRTGDDGRQFNAVRSFDVLGIDTGDDPDFGSPAEQAEPTPETGGGAAAAPAPDRLFTPRPVSAMEAGR